MTILIILSSVFAYFIIGGMFQGYVAGVNQHCKVTHWLYGLDYMPLPLIGWPFFPIVFLFRFPYRLAAKFGEQTSIRQMEAQRERQEKLYNLRKELEEAEREVEQSLLEDAVPGSQSTSHRASKSSTYR